MCSREEFGVLTLVQLSVSVSFSFCELKSALKIYLKFSNTATPLEAKPNIGLVALIFGIIKYSHHPKFVLLATTEQNQG